MGDSLTSLVTCKATLFFPVTMALYLAALFTSTSHKVFIAGNALCPSLYYTKPPYAQEKVFSLTRHPYL